MTSFLLAITALAATGHSKAQTPEISVLILGTYHMSNPKLDLVKTDIRDTMGADRQKEIVDLVAKIAKFRPTRIVVEAVPQQTISIKPISST